MNKLDELKKMLDSHDWYYHYSDDPRWYQAGADSAAKIADMMRNATVEMKQLYNEYHARIFNKPTFVTAHNPYVAPYKI